MRTILTFYFLVFTLMSCNNNKQNTCKQQTIQHLKKERMVMMLNFIKNHSKNVLELQNGDAKVLLCADYQGRVFTSTAAGDSGTSFGWLNYNLLSSGEKKKQFNPVGGEERFWLGPEGGQYSIYFKKDDPFDYAHWQVPALIDTIAL